MSALSNYSSLSKQTKRYIWLGYLAYLIYMGFFGGFDLIIEKIIPTGNDVLQIMAFLSLYWLVALLILWASDN
jgi:hypothetical protein